MCSLPFCQAVEYYAAVKKKEAGLQVLMWRVPVEDYVRSKGVDFLD